MSDRAGEILYYGKLGREQWCSLRVTSVGKLSSYNIRRLRMVLDIIDEACREDERSAQPEPEDTDSCIYEPLRKAGA